MLYFGLAIAGLVIVVDQVSKIIVLSALGPFQGVSVTPFFNLVVVLNTGISFGLFASEGELARYILVALALIVSIILMRLPTCAHF